MNQAHFLPIHFSKFESNCDIVQRKCEIYVKQETVISRNPFLFINIESTELKNHKWAWHLFYHDKGDGFPKLFIGAENQTVRRKHLKHVRRYYCILFVQDITENNVRTKFGENQSNLATARAKLHTYICSIKTFSKEKRSKLVLGTRIGAHFIIPCLNLTIKVIKIAKYFYGSSLISW